MVVITKYNYKINRDGESREGVSYRAIVDGVSYKVNEETANELIKEADIVFNESRFYDNDKKVNISSYTLSK